MIAEEVIFTFKATLITPKKFSYATVKSLYTTSTYIGDKKLKHSKLQALIYTYIFYMKIPTIKPKKYVELNC